MKVKVSLIGLMDMLKFKHLRDKRKEMIDKAPATPIKTDYAANRIAAYYHPKAQYLKIAEIVELNKDTKTFSLVPDETKGTKELAPFKAGSYLSIHLNIDGSSPSRAYSLSSSPSEAFKNIYKITVKRKVGGFVSNYLLDKAKVGDALWSSDPGGNMTCSRLRDAHDVIAVAGGVGITPFYSLAQAVLEGQEDCNLTILYGANKKEDLIFTEEFKAIQRQTSKVRVVYVLAEEEVEGYEHGYVTADIIKKYAPKGVYSLFASGPTGLLKFLDQQVKALNLEHKYVRMERTPESLPGGNGKVYTLTVHDENTTYAVKAQDDETILAALERAGINVRSKCHMGICGVCRFRLIKGECEAAPEQSLLMGDEQFGYYHACAVYPRSDLEIEIPHYLD